MSIVKIDVGHERNQAESKTLSRLRKNYFELFRRVMKHLKIKAFPAQHIAQIPISGTFSATR